MIKKLLTVLFVIVAFALGLFLARSYYKPAPEQQVKEATVLLEKIETVAKLVTVEGHFSELYSYKDYWRYDWPIFRKKAILRVQAKVSVGYDLSNMQIDANQTDKIIVISNIPEEPEILSVDHEVDYYDLKQGTFNSFTQTDYNELMEDAKRFIEQKAQESDLIDSAEAQGIEILDLIRFLVENAGWEVRFENTKGIIKVDTTANQLLK
ncbi:MAG: DUF4230 domain-containing protein [Bacteroidota bacterium]